MAEAPGWLLQAFEKTLAQWMEQFHALLTFDNAALAEPSPDAESALDGVKAAVCQNINLLIGRDEEEFEPFLERFVNAVWTQLVSVTLKPGQVCPAHHQALVELACAGKHVHAARQPFCCCTGCGALSAPA